MNDATVGAAVVVVVVASRLVAPLFIPKHPLPAILLCLVLDANDREVLETFTHVNLLGYQGADKALDIFYLTIAMLSVLRNWTNWSAVQLARFLYYYRLVGVAIFEFSHWRPILLIFPNTFEYFFILYEVVRLRWSVESISGRFFTAAAALIRVVIKLPQEYWIHVLHLDVTDLVKTIVFDVDPDAPWADAVGHRPEALAIFVAGAVGLVVAARGAVSAWAPPQKRQDLAPAPYPTNIDQPRERIIWIAKFWRVFDSHLAEKIVLITLVTVIFAQALPDLPVTTTEFIAGVAVVVTFNSFLAVRSANNLSPRHVVNALKPTEAFEEYSGSRQRLSAAMVSGQGPFVRLHWAAGRRRPSSRCRSWFAPRYGSLGDAATRGPANRSLHRLRSRMTCCRIRSWPVRSRRGAGCSTAPAGWSPRARCGPWA